MTSTDVIGIYSTMDDIGIHIWIDGGWGVDALLSRQTRLHKDLDIVIQHQQVPQFERSYPFRATGGRNAKLKDLSTLF